MKYEVYKNGNKSVVAIPKSFTEEQALTIANEHFKVKKSDLFIETGRTLGDEELIYPKKTGDVWVIGRNI